MKRNGYVDQAIVDDIARGIPTSGDIVPSGALLARGKVAETTLAERPKEIAQRNAEAISRAKRFRNSAERTAYWGETKQEIDAGRLTHPVSLTSDMAESLCFHPHRKL